MLASGWSKYGAMFDAMLPPSATVELSEKSAFISSSSLACASTVPVVACRASECMMVATASSCARPTSPIVSTSDATMVSTSENPASLRASWGSIMASGPART